MESTFENQAVPSLSGWRDGQPIYGREATISSFSNDVPLNGTRWSLKVNYPDTMGSQLDYVFKPILPSLMRHYMLTFWYKGFGSPYQDFDVDLNVYVGNTIYAEDGFGTSSSWTQDTVTYFSPTFVPDSLMVSIVTFGSKAESDSSHYVLFNSFKVEEY